MVNVGDYVRHRNGKEGRVVELQGAFVCLEYDPHRYAIRLLIVLELARATSKPAGDPQR